MGVFHILLLRFSSFKQKKLKNRKTEKQKRNDAFSNEIKK